MIKFSLCTLCHMSPSWRLIMENNERYFKIYSRRGASKFKLMGKMIVMLKAWINRKSTEHKGNIKK
ncbi:unnamed protein product [Rhodiola kirilowii]